MTVTVDRAARHAAGRARGDADAPRSCATARELATGSTTLRVELAPLGAFHDRVDLGNAASEQAHGLTAAPSSGTSSEAGLTRRYAGHLTPFSWFEFDLKVVPGEAFVLRVIETYDRAQTKRYKVYVDGREVHLRQFGRDSGGTLTYEFAVPAVAPTTPSACASRTRTTRRSTTRRSRTSGRCPSDGSRAAAYSSVSPDPSRPTTTCCPCARSQRRTSTTPARSARAARSSRRAMDRLALRREQLHVDSKRRSAARRVSAAPVPEAVHVEVHRPGTAPAGAEATRAPTGRAPSAGHSAPRTTTCGWRTPRPNWPGSSAGIEVPAVAEPDEGHGRSGRTAARSAGAGGRPLDPRALRRGDQYGLRLRLTAGSASMQFLYPISERILSRAWEPSAG